MDAEERGSMDFKRYKHSFFERRQKKIIERSLVVDFYQDEVQAVNCPAGGCGSEVRSRRRVVEEVSALGGARAAGFRIRVVLAEVVLLMRGPFVAKAHIFLLHLALPPRLLPTFGRDIVLRGWGIVRRAVGRCTVTVTRAKGEARLCLPGILVLPQHAAQRAVPQGIPEIGIPRGVRAPTPSAEVQVFAGFLGRRSGHLGFGRFRVEERRVKHVVEVDRLRRMFRRGCKLRRR